MGIVPNTSETSTAGYSSISGKEALPSTIRHFSPQTLPTFLQKVLINALKIGRGSTRRNSVGP